MNLAEADTVHWKAQPSRMIVMPPAPESVLVVPPDHDADQPHNQKSLHVPVLVLRRAWSLADVGRRHGPLRRSRTQRIWMDELIAVGVPAESLGRIAVLVMVEWT